MTFNGSTLNHEEGIILVGGSIGILICHSKLTKVIKNSGVHSFCVHKLVNKSLFI